MTRTIIYIDNFLTGHGHTPTTGITLVNEFREQGYKVITSSSQKNVVLRIADMLYTICSNRHHSVVLIATYSTSAFYFAWACALLSRLLRIPYVPCLHGGNLPQRIKGSSTMSKHLFGHSLINVAVSGYLQQCMIANNWKSVVIPNSIHLANYPFKHRTHCAPTLLWVRSFHEIYNPTLAIRILSALAEIYPNASLTMVGPDKDGSLANCKQLANQLGVDDRVKFTGMLSVEAWTGLSADFDFFINTTNFDNLPVSVIEAMALGMITISTDVGGIPFLITHQLDGLLVPPNNHQGFVKTIAAVLNVDQTAAGISLAARKKAESFDRIEVIKKWNYVFNAIPVS